MTQLITDLEKAFEAKAKIAYLRNYYHGENDVLLGVVPATETREAEEVAQQAIRKFLSSADYGWREGQIVDGKEIAHISYRIDQIQDWELPDYRRDFNETYAELEERTGKKIEGSGADYIIASVARRFKDVINDLPPLVDDEEQGWITGEPEGIADDLEDQ